MAATKRDTVMLAESDHAALDYLKTRNLQDSQAEAIRFSAEMQCRHDAEARTAAEKAAYHQQWAAIRASCVDMLKKGREFGKDENALESWVFWRKQAVLDNLEAVMKFWGFERRAEAIRFVIRAQAKRDGFVSEPIVVEGQALAEKILDKAIKSDQLPFAPVPEIDAESARTKRVNVMLAESDLDALDFVKARHFQSSQARAIRFSAEMQCRLDGETRTDPENAAYHQQWAEIRESCVDMLKKGRGIGKEEIALQQHVYSLRQKDWDNLATVMRTWSLRKCAEAIRFVVRVQAKRDGFVSQPIVVEAQDLSDDILDIEFKRGKLRFSDVAVSDVEAYARQRRGQHRLRVLTLDIYGNQCALCDISDATLLVTSHIVRWADDVTARADLSNLICLCRFHDALFEGGYFALTDEHQVVKKSTGQCEMLTRLLDLASRFRIKNEQYLPKPRYLQKHRERAGIVP